jgi:hypothetical protein
MGDGSDLIDFNADLTNLAHNPALLLPGQTNGLNQADAMLNTTAAPLHIPAGLDEVVLDGQPSAATVPIIAGPSTAGSGLFDNLSSAPGPSTASMQAHVDDDEAQRP